MSQKFSDSFDLDRESALLGNHNDLVSDIARLEAEFRADVSFALFWW